MHNRRKFLVTSSALLAGITLRTGLAQRLASEDTFTNATLGAYQQGILTQPQFEHRIGSLFMFFSNTMDVVYARLRSVTPYELNAPAKLPGRMVTPHAPIRSLTRQVNTFTLLFDCENQLPAQKSLIADHATLGRFVMFLVPGTSSSGTPTCSSVFTNFAEA